MIKEENENSKSNETVQKENENYINEYLKLIKGYDPEVIKKAIRKGNMQSSIVKTVLLSAYKVTKYFLSKLHKVFSFSWKTNFNNFPIYFTAFSFFGFQTFLLYKNFYKKKKITSNEFGKEIFRNFINIFSSAFVFATSLRFFTIKSTENPFKAFLVKMIPTILISCSFNYYLENYLDKLFGNSSKLRVLDVLKSDEVVQNAKKICELGKEKASEYYESAKLILERYNHNTTH
jgi:hypothetical protein